MKRWILLMAIAGCGRSPDAAPRSPDSTGTASPAIEPAPRDTGEAGAIRGSAGAVKRVGALVTIATRSGAAVSLADDSTEGDGYRSYRYQGRLVGAPFHLFRVGYYEGGGWLLVHDSTGRQRMVDGFPVTNPAGTRVAIGNMDLEAAFEPNVVEVFRLERDSLTSEWRVEPEKWGPDSLVWRGSDTLALIQRWRDSVAGQYRPVRARAVREGASWRLGVER